MSSRIQNQKFVSSAKEALNFDNSVSFDILSCVLVRPMLPRVTVYPPLEALTWKSSADR